TGTLSAVTTVTVGTQVSGTVKTLSVDFNAHVTKGALLCELDPAIFTAQVSQAKAQLATALAQERLAKSKVTAADPAEKRAEDSPKKDLTSQADRESASSALEGAKAELDSADAQVTQARAALELAEVNLSHTKIYAPVDGIVIDRKVDVGVTVAASLSAPE